MIYNLTDEVGRGNVQGAVMLLGTLIDSGFHPLAILKAVSNRFTRISIVKTCIEKNIPKREIGQKLGYKDKAVNNLITQARGWNFRSLGKAFNEIATTDYRLKSSRIKGRLIMEELVFKLVELRGQS